MACRSNAGNRRLPNPEYTFTDEWLADRATFLIRKDWFNVNNRDPLGSIGEATPGSSPYLTEGIRFEDASSDYTIAPGVPNEAQTFPTRHFYFGDEQGNSYAGGSSVDRLYGGAGGDTLSGDRGNDHIEGNSGDDSSMAAKATTRSSVALGSTPL